MHPITIIALIVFVILAVGVVIITSRGKVMTLGKLAIPKSEKILLEEDVKFEAWYRSERLRRGYLHGHIIVTSRRIITCQRPLFGKNKDDYILRHVIYYNEAGPEPTVSDFVNPISSRFTKEGHMALFTSLERISYPIYRGKKVVQITIPFKNHGPLFVEPVIRIFSNDTSAFQKTLK